MGRIASRSTKAAAAAWNSSATSSRSYPPRGSAGSPGSPPVTISLSSPIPESPDSAIAPLLTSLAPVYAFGLWDAVHIRPPSSPREPTVK